MQELGGVAGPRCFDPNVRAVREPCIRGIGGLMRPLGQVDWSNGEGLERAGVRDGAGCSPRAHRFAGRALLVTQTEAAVQEDGAVVTLEQEQQSGKVGLERRATLNH